MPRFRATTYDLSAAPPPEVMAQIDVAWERARELFASDMELRFEVDRWSRRVWAELRLADGSVAERLSASDAVALACGDATADLALAA